MNIPGGPTFFRESIGRRITPQNPYQCEESYYASGVFHIARTLIERTGRVYELTIHVDSAPGEQGTPSDEYKVSELLQSLGQLNLETVFSFDTVFEFSKDASMRLLPIRLPIMTGTVIDEFRGFFGVKKFPNGKVAYKLSIESPDLEELYVNVQFDYRDVLNAASFEHRLQESTDIVRNIVPEDEWERKWSHQA